MNPVLIMLIGSAVQSGGSMFGSLLAKKQSKYASDIAEYNARYIDAASRIEEAKIDRYAAQVKSAQKAATAASGIRTDVGAPVEIEVETDILADIDKNILRISGGIEKIRYGIEARMGKAQGLAASSTMQAQGFGSLLSSTVSYGNRAGWFAPNTAQADAPSYPRNYRSF